MAFTDIDSLQTKSSLTVNGKTYQYFNLGKSQDNGLGDISRLPFSLKILLENLLRYEDAKTVASADIQAVANWLKTRTSSHEIAYRPARVLMQDFTGVPAVVDLAAMRDATVKLGQKPNKINPRSPVDLIIDHSVQVDKFASTDAFDFNVKMEMQRNYERYEFLKWGQKALDNFRVVPPGTGICHQVNLEYLGKTVWSRELDGEMFAYPDTLVGTDSHTTMINGLGVLGWGVGGIEAEAAMLGQPISMLIPEVIGFKLKGKLREGVTATDLVLTITQMLREKGVVGKFVEFFGPGLSHLPLANRATVSNMSPEFGATCGFFPVDTETLKYMRLTGRDEDTIALVETYCKNQGLWRDDATPDPIFTGTLELDLKDVVPSLAGPKRPQDRVAMDQLGQTMTKIINASERKAGKPINIGKYDLNDGDVVIAAITSCTNTSNPEVLIAAGLIAKKAIERGISVKPWVKTSLAPGSKVVTEYLEKTGLQKYLDKLGFNLVGYGCTTCIGNSGPLPEKIHHAIVDNDMLVCAVLSGNRNFEGRVHPLTRANWLASPPLVVAYALAGTTKINLSKDSLGKDGDGDDVYLKDIWPGSDEIHEEVASITSEMFRKQYKDIFSGDKEWKKIDVSSSMTYHWSDKSTYIQNPPFFENLRELQLVDVKGANILALLGDSVTTDHISPAGAIAVQSPASQYLQSKGVKIKDFNSYGSRRGNHEVMMRGTFANIRIRNEMVPGTEGGFTKFIPSGQVMPIYDAAMQYKAQNTPLVVLAGKEYGTGSSRDWAAKGTSLLGVKAVLAETFERIHRSNLIGMGVLPLRFKEGMTWKTLKLTGEETIDIIGIDKILPNGDVSAIIHYKEGHKKEILLSVRIETENELKYYQHGGILHYVLQN